MRPDRILSRRRRQRTQRGTLSLELAIIAPMLLLLLFLFIAYGRYGQTTGLLEQGARDAARSATQTRSWPDMETAILRVQDQIAADLPTSCANSLSPQYPPPGAFEAGALITVTFSCDVSFTDLMLPGSGGGGGWAGREVTRSFTSRLDPNRGTY